MGVQRHEIGTWLVVAGLAGLVAPWVGAIAAAAGILVLLKSPTTEKAGPGQYRLVLLAGAVIVVSSIGLTIADILSTHSPLDTVRASFAEAPGSSYFVIFPLLSCLTIFYTVGIQGKRVSASRARSRGAGAPALLVIPMGMISYQYWGDWGWFALFAFMAITALLTGALEVWHLRRRAASKQGWAAASPSSAVLDHAGRMENRQASTRHEIGTWLVVAGLAGLVAPWVGGRHWRLPAFSCYAVAAHQTKGTSKYTPAWSCWRGPSWWSRVWGPATVDLLSAH